MIPSIQRGLLSDGVLVPMTKLCMWFGAPRRSVYYQPVKSARKVDPRFSQPIKAMIGKEPSFGYRTVAWLLGFKRNTMQRVFQFKAWQVRTRPIGMRPRIGAAPSVAESPNERALSAMHASSAGQRVDRPVLRLGGAGSRQIPRAFPVSGVFWLFCKAVPRRRSPIPHRSNHLRICRIFGHVGVGGVRARPSRSPFSFLHELCHNLLNSLNYLQIRL